MRRASRHISVISYSSSYSLSLSLKTRVTFAASASDPLTLHKSQMPSSTSTTTTTSVVTPTSFLSQQQSIDIDVELLAVFDTFQLMELAGLSVAQAIAYDVATHMTWTPSSMAVVVLCGSGNNGGDGLVAARHLHYFGFTNISVIYPKLHATDLKPLYKSLLDQLKWCDGVTIRADLDPMLLRREGERPPSRRPVLVVDAVFGYSFRGAIREPYRSLLQTVRQWHEEEDDDGAMMKTPGHRHDTKLLVAVDVPSGWDVEKGPRDPLTTEVGDLGLGAPDVLVSLMQAKEGVRGFQGRHYVGGRFVPSAIVKKYNLQLPVFEGTAQFAEVRAITPKM